MHKADIEVLADAIRNTADGIATFNHQQIGITEDQTRQAIGMFVDNLAEWLLHHEAANVRPGYGIRFHPDQFLDACGFPRPADQRVMGGGYLDQAIALYESGLSVSKVAERVGISRHILLYEMKHAGVRFRGMPGSAETGY